MLGGAAEHSEVYPQLPVSVRGGRRGGGDRQGDRWGMGAEVIYTQLPALFEGSGSAPFKTHSHSLLSPDMSRTLFRARNKKYVKLSVSNSLQPMLHISTTFNDSNDLQKSMLAYSVTGSHQAVGTPPSLLLMCGCAICIQHGTCPLSFSSVNSFLRLQEHVASDRQS